MIRYEMLEKARRLSKEFKVNSVNCALEIINDKIYEAAYLGREEVCITTYPYLKKELLFTLKKRLEEEGFTIWDSGNSLYINWKE